MKLEAINEQLLRAIGAGVALLEPADLSFRFFNEAFGDWFPEAGAGVALTTCLPDLKPDEIQDALKSSGRFATDTMFRKKRRTLIIAIVFTLTDAGVVLMECQNITRIRELETMIESYSTMVERNTRDLQKEKERVEKLLLNVMPRNVYDEYKAFGVVTPQEYEPVTVLALDFIDFNARATEIAPSVLVSEVNDIFAAFDRIGEQFGCERIKTVGDSYVAICGFPEPTDNHATLVTSAALRFVRYLDRRNQTHDHTWQCRIGIATGPVIGSVVGVQKYVYDVFGPAVNRARRVRDHASAMEILGCDQIGALLSNDFEIEDKGSKDLRDLGSMTLCHVSRALE